MGQDVTTASREVEEKLEVPAVTPAKCAVILDPECRRNAGLTWVSSLVSFFSSPPPPVNTGSRW